MIQLRKNNASHVLDALFAFSLFGLFVVIGTCVVLFGSKVYRSTAAQLEENYTSRTALAYVSEKLRQSDVSDGITLESLSFKDEADSSPAITALVFTQTIGETDYRTYIYFYDGSLRELFIRADADISPGQGTALLSLSDFTIEEDGDGFYLLTAQEEDGNTAQLLIHPKSLQRR
jgi:hypothetical protein